MRNTVAQYRFQKPEEIFELARQLSQHFDDPQNVMIGIYELLLNAVEHGNLGIDSAYKEELLSKGTFGHEMNRRLSLSENSNKYVEVELQENVFFQTLSIRDQGMGFDWRHVFNTIRRDDAYSGRGLTIARSCGFDFLAFNAAGNTVTCLCKNKAEMRALAKCHYSYPCNQDCPLLGYCEIKHAAAA